MEALATLATTVLVAGCTSQGITSSRLNHAVGTSFQRLYALQQRDLGHDQAVTADSAATCLRSGSSALSGSGSWICTVHYPYADGHLLPLSFDVEVQPIGCYTATGPPSVVGQLKLATPDGGTVINPLFAFDGCFRVA